MQPAELFADGFDLIDVALVEGARIRIDGARFVFSEGERIHTESSYKYRVEEFHALARRAGLYPLRVWTDSDRLFSLHYLGKR